MTWLSNADQLFKVELLIWLINRPLPPGSDSVMVFYLTSDMILHKLIGQIANLMADGLSRLERRLEVDATPQPTQTTILFKLSPRVKSQNNVGRRRDARFDKRRAPGDGD